MFRKSKALTICAAAFCILFSSCFNIESKAATNYDYSSPHSEPTVDLYSGYINVVTDSGLSTFAWRITPATNDVSYTNVSSMMNITIINGGIKLSPQTDGYAFVSIWGLYADGSSAVYFNTQIDKTANQVLYIGDVHAYSFYGNYGMITDEVNTSALKNTVSVSWSGEQSVLSSIISVYHAVVDMNNNLGGTLDNV